MQLMNLNLQFKMWHNTFYYISKAIRKKQAKDLTWTFKAESKVITRFLIEDLANGARGPFPLPLAQICQGHKQLSLLMGYIPQAFKVAVIKPLLIHYVIQLLGNYRSISMLCPGLAVSMKKGQNNKQNQLFQKGRCYLNPVWNKNQTTDKRYP